MPFPGLPLPLQLLLFHYLQEHNRLPVLPRLYSLAKLPFLYLFLVPPQHPWTSDYLMSLLSALPAVYYLACPSAPGFLLMNSRWSVMALLVILCFLGLSLASKPLMTCFLLAR